MYLKEQQINSKHKVVFVGLLTDITTNDLRTMLQTSNQYHKTFQLFEDETFVVPYFSCGQQIQ